MPEKRAPEKKGPGKKGPVNCEAHAIIQNFHIIRGIYKVYWYALELHDDFSDFI